MGQGRGTGSANNPTGDDRLNAESNDSNVNGQKGNRNSELSLVKKGISIDGKKVSVDSVIGEYESKAYETMDKTNIPKGMQEVVKEYFTELNK